MTNISNTKRSAIEQQLMTSAILHFKEHFNDIRLNDKNCKLHVNIIPNDGGGRFVEGRYSITGMFRRDYITQDRDAQQIIINPASDTENILNRNNQFSTDINYKGLGNYDHNVISSDNDTNYLKRVFSQWITLKGCKIVSKQQEMSGMGGGEPQSSNDEPIETTTEKVDFNIVINVYSFGTVHSRSEWVVLDDETLKFLFIAELTILDSNLAITRQPELVGYETRYSERYLLWQGPVEVIRNAKVIDIKSMYPLSK
ncbi:hypothetical protein TI05_04595 [Achromatium sp. WMS3]|nr:hypothetical protein TI05_04595 [Achromatium sp. WMS3]